MNHLTINTTACGLPTYAMTAPEAQLKIEWLGVPVEPVDRSSEDDERGRAQRVKKQHYVPRFYLRRFTQDGSHLFACDTFDGRSYGARVEDVASESYFYDAPLDTEASRPGDRDPLQTLEHELADLEASASSAVDALIK